MAVAKLPKEEILSKALQVFRQQGYHATSMDDLAKFCGLQKGSFYYHFSSKEDMMQEVLNMAHLFFSEKIESIAISTHLTTKEKMLAMKQAAIAAFTQNQGGCIFGNTVLETLNTVESFRPKLRAFFDNWIAVFTKVYAEVLPQAIAQKEARRAVGNIEGGLLLMRLYNDISYFEEAMDAAISRTD